MFCNIQHNEKTYLKYQEGKDSWWHDWSSAIAFPLDLSLGGKNNWSSRQLQVREEL